MPPCLNILVRNLDDSIEIEKSKEGRKKEEMQLGVCVLPPSVSGACAALLLKERLFNIRTDKSVFRSGEVRSANRYVIRGQKEEETGTMARLVPQPADGPKFCAPIHSYDVHIYFWQTDAANTAVAKELREECINTFPDLNIYKFWDQPIGPHPIGMFEVDLKTTEQFSRFVPWIQVNRRGLSVLVHPNTGRPLYDHTKNAIWIGERVPLNTSHLPETEPAP